MKKPRCPVHDYDLDPAGCSFCTTLVAWRDARLGEPCSGPEETFVDVRGLKADGSGIIVWNQPKSRMDS